MNKIDPLIALLILSLTLSSVYSLIIKASDLKFGILENQKTLWEENIEYQNKVKEIFTTE